GLADLYTRINGAKLNYYRNITHTLKNGKPGPESSLDKLLVSELTKELFDFAMTIQGHAGILMAEDACSMRICKGNTSLHSVQRLVAAQAKYNVTRLANEFSDFQKT
ncbi:acyl-CoA dehydrogenase family protein, partial [Planococcus faecalis]|uniref:acyl-CoA dehydrogenase family protein n=1 Tax=Planococcus faecalis TaxID=1598147 RepID=UPI00210C8F90